MGPCWICQLNISLLIMTATSIFGANYWYYVLLGSITLSLSRASPTVEIPSSKEKGKNFLLSLLRLRGSCTSVGLRFE